MKNDKGTTATDDLRKRLEAAIASIDSALQDARIVFGDNPGACSAGACSARNTNALADLDALRAVLDHPERLMVPYRPSGADICCPRCGEKQEVVFHYAPPSAAAPSEAGRVSVPREQPKWIADLATQYGSRQMAALKGDDQLVRACNKWIAIIVVENWLELRAMLSAAPAPASRTEHVWVPPKGPIKWEHCGICGVIKRKDGQNSACKGRAPVGPRSGDEYMDGYADGFSQAIKDGADAPAPAATKGTAPSATAATEPVGVYVENVDDREAAMTEFGKLVDGAASFSGKLPMLVENGLCIALTGTGPLGVKNAYRIANALNAVTVDSQATAAPVEETATVASLKAALEAKQAKIDALMLEFCPDEMTAEQVANWAAH